MGIILCILSIGLCSYLGFQFAKKYTRRESLFSDTLVFLEDIKSQIGFFEKPLGQIITNSLTKYSNDLSQMLTQYNSILSQHIITTNENIRENIVCKILTNAEIDLYVQLFENLGKSDRNFQLQMIDEFKGNFNKLHTYSLGEKNKFSLMYKKVGVLCGIGIGIIFI